LDARTEIVSTTVNRAGILGESMGLVVKKGKTDGNTYHSGQGRVRKDRGNQSVRRNRGKGRR